MTTAPDTGRAGLSALTIETLAVCLVAAPFAYALVFFVDLNVAAEPPRAPWRGWLVLGGWAALVGAVWALMVRAGVRRVRAEGLAEDDPGVDLLERGLDVIFVGCGVVAALKLVRLDLRIVELCFAAVGVFLSTTRIALSLGLRVPVGRWPFARIALIVALVALTWL